MIKKIITTSLHFCRILDENNQLSLTQISLIGILTQSLYNKSLPPGLLGIGLLAYTAKKILLIYQSKYTKPSVNADELIETIRKLQDDLLEQKSKISAISMSAGLRPTPQIQRR